MKKALLIFTSLLFVLLFITPAFAEDADVLVEKNYLVDLAGIFSEEEQQQIALNISNAVLDCKMDIVVVTVDDAHLGIKTLMEYADDYYDYNGYGKNGVLLLMRFVDKEYAGRGNSWISTSGKAIDAISDSDIQDIGAEITPDLLQGDYLNAVSEYVSMANKLIKKGTSLDFGKIALWAAAVGVIVTIIVNNILKNQLKSVKQATDASNYIVDGSVAVLGSYDHFLYSTVASVAKQTSSSSSGSSTHTSSSGNTHGGGGF